MTGERWTPQELEIVLRYNDLSDEVLAAQLPGRTAKAYKETRNAAHVYHAGGHPTFHLSQRLQQWLAEHRGTYKCPRCEELL